MNLKTIFKKNWIFILILLVGVLCLAKKDRFVSVDIVAHPDSWIAMETDERMEQTWQTNVKKIAGVDVPFRSEDTFSADVTMQLVMDDGATVLQEASFRKEFSEGEEGILSFRWEPEKVQVGNRYRVRLEFRNTSVTANIELRVGNEYWGCSLDGNETGSAAAFQIIGVKNSRLFWLFVSFFPFLSFAFLFMILYERKWEETIGISMILSVHILQLFGFLGKLELAFCFLFAAAVISFFAAVYLVNIRQKDIKEFLTPGLILYAGLILFILINNNGVWLARWDEFSHWGLAAKDMFYYDALSRHVNSSVSFQRYPAFTTLIEYYWAYMNGMFSYNTLYVGFQIMFVSLLMITCKGITWKNKKLCFPAFVIIVLVPIGYFSDVFNSLYADPMLAILMAYVLVCYFGEKGSFFNRVRILGGLIAITWTKETGIAIAGLTAAIMLGDTLLEQWKEKKLNARKMLFPIVCIFMVCVIFLVWQIYLSMPVKTGQQATESIVVNREVDAETEMETFPRTSGTVGASGISWDGVKELLTFHGEPYQYQSFRNFASMFFSNEQFMVGWWKLAYFDLFLLMIILAGILKLCKINQNDRLISFSVFSFLAGIVYAIFLMFLYVFAFSSVESLLLSSNRRYLGSFCCGVFLAFCMLLLEQVIKQAEEIPRKKAEFAAVLAAAFLCIGIPMEGLINKNMYEEVTRPWSEMQQSLSEVFRSFASESEKVYAVTYEGSGLEQFMVMNAVSPVSSLNPGGEVQYLPKDWKKVLREYDYVLVVHGNEKFIREYGDFFEQPESVKDGAYYRVVKSEEGIALRYMGDTEMRRYDD